MAGKKYKVVVSERAKRMLGSHVRFLARVNKAAAASKKKQIIDELATLAEMPQRFPSAGSGDVISNGYRKMYIANWYLAIYHISDDTVFVDYILDCRQDNEWLIHS